VGGVPSFVLVVVGIGAGEEAGRMWREGREGASCLRRSREKRNLGSAGPADLGGLMVGHEVWVDAGWGWVSGVGRLSGRGGGEV
jgi:hypothetical protein